MLKVLHVDRSVFFQKVIKDILIRHGIDIESVPGKKEALDCLSRKQYDVVITGLELADSKGQDLIRSMSAAGIIKPVVVVTSTESLEQRQELFELGVTDYILKQDLSDEKLVSYIQSLVDEDPVIASMKHMKIAALDDSRLELQIITTIFELFGLSNLQVFSDPEELLDYPDKFDMYILDLVLPKTSGEEVVRRIRAENKEAIIVVASSINHNKTVAHVLNSGANDYITKPFDAQLFMARIKSTVRTFQLLADVRKQNHEINRLASVDDLTGVWNHRVLMAKIEEEYERYTTRKRDSLGIMMLDIDNFKHVNDTHSHQTGDEVLRLVCEALQKTFGSEAFVGRYGGEEFLVIFDDISAARARDLARKSLAAVTEAPVGHKQLQVSFSGGMAFCNGQDASKLVAQADAALYHAKKQGKNRIIEAAG